jgi:hypothetical protein
MSRAHRRAVHSAACLQGVELMTLSLCHVDTARCLSSHHSPSFASLSAHFFLFPTSERRVLYVYSFIYSFILPHNLFPMNLVYLFLFLFHFSKNLFPVDQPPRRKPESAETSACFDISPSCADDRRTSCGCTLSCAVNRLMGDFQVGGNKSGCVLTLALAVSTPYFDRQTW